MSEKYIDVIAKMIDLTQSGRLVWKAHLPSDTLKVYPDDKVSTVFVTKYQGKTLRLYQRTYKVRQVPSLIRAAVGDNEWLKEVVLEFLSEDGSSLWAFPQMAILKDLLSTVRYKVAGVDEFINEILEE